MQSAPKVLIADLFSKANIANLKSKGFTVHYDDKLNGDALKKFMTEFQPHVLVVRSTKVTAAHLTASPNLHAVIRAGSGVDTIDIKTASELGIAVGNCPGKNADAVAELVMGIILALDRRIVENVVDLRNKQWNKGEYSKATGLKGKTLGIIGFGFIGRELAKRATGFGVNIIASDPHLLKGEAPKPEYVTIAKSIDELLAVSDIVSLHVPAVKSTKGMVNKEFLSKMKKDATLINGARGDLVVEADLVEHLNTNKAFRYGADVFVGEPADKKAVFDNKLASHPSTYGTHHIGASTNQAEDAIGDEAYRMIVVFAETKKLPNTVNSAELKPRTPAKPRL